MAKQTPQEMWEEVLTGNSKGLMRMRSIMGAIPAGPRCKLCAAPFGRPGRTVLKLIGAGPSPLNRGSASSASSTCTRSPAAPRSR